MGIRTQTHDGATPQLGGYCKIEVASNAHPEDRATKAWLLLLTRKGASRVFRSKEQENFAKLIAAHINNPDAPLLLEGGTGLGKTRAYLAPLIASGKRVAIVLPTHQLIDQLLDSSDIAATCTGVSLAAFRPVSWFESRTDYNEQKAAASKAQVMLCTSASVIIDQCLKGEYNGALHRDYILFDEADQLPAAAALQSDCEIHKIDLDDLGIKATTGEETAGKVLSEKRHAPQELKAAANMIMECYENPAWYHTAGVTDEGGLRLYHRLPGRLLKRVANQPNVAFVSATLSLDRKFNNFSTAMGIESISRSSSVIEPTRHGDLTFKFNPLKVKDDKGSPNPSWLEAVKAEIEACQKPALVITPSFELSNALQVPNTTIRGRDETSGQACQRLTENGVLIAANAWAGLDTPIQWASVIIPKVPYDAPTVLDDEIESTYLHSRGVALRRMRQGIGRGLRTPEAVCEIIVMDDRAAKLRFTPERFSEAWNAAVSKGQSEVVALQEGRQYTHEVTAYERSPQVRKAAFKHHGKECQGQCGFQVRHESQLDVHHMDELSENHERSTKVDRLAVLCANCHRLIHSQRPAMSLDALRGLLAEEGAA